MPRLVPKGKRLAEFFAQYPMLPDDALAPDPYAAALLAISVWTLKRTNPVPPRQISERIRGRRIGDLRALLRGEVTA